MGYSQADAALHLARLERILQRVTLRNAPIPMTLKGQPEPFGVQVVFRGTVRDRNTGSPFELISTVNLSAELMALATDETIARCIARGMAELYRHEARESFHFDGVRLDDPHAPDP